jgi:hypothetical protein
MTRVSSIVGLPECVRPRIAGVEENVERTVEAYR